MRRWPAFVGMVLLAMVLLQGCAVPTVDEVANAIEGQLAAWAMKQMASTTKLVAQSLLATPVAWLSSPGFVHLYGRTTLLANELVAVLVVGFGLARMFGLAHEAQPGEVLFRLLGAALAVNAAPWAVALLAAIANQMAQAIIFQGDATADLATSVQGMEVALLVFLVWYVWFLVRLLVQFGYRAYSLVFWTVAAPLIFVASAFPGQQGILRWWGRRMAGLLVEQVVNAVQYVVLIELTMGAAGWQVAGPFALVVQLGGLASMTEAPGVVRELLDAGPSPERMVKAALDLLTLRQLRATVGRVSGGIGWRRR